MRTVHSIKIIIASKYKTFFQSYQKRTYILFPSSRLLTYYSCLLSFKGIPTRARELISVSTCFTYRYRSAFYYHRLPANVHYLNY